MFQASLYTTHRIELHCNALQYSTNSDIAQTINTHEITVPRKSLHYCKSENDDDVLSWQFWQSGQHGDVLI